MRFNGGVKRGVCSCLILVMICCSCLYSTLPAMAATKTVINAEEGKSYLFAVPEGGWSTMRVRVEYTEEYSNNSSSYTSTFYHREKACMFSRAYATTMPVLYLDNVVHRSSSGTSLKTFSSWTAIDLLYDPSRWQGANGYKNTTNASYTRSTSNYGTLSYRVSCGSGGIPAVSADSLTLSLKTD